MAIKSWWQFGEGFGYSGPAPALYKIECAFCGERGNWELEHHAQKKKPNGYKILSFDTYQCGNCASYSMVFWSKDEHSSGPLQQGLHDYRVLPWPLETWDGEDYWPGTVTRLWKQANNALQREDYDAAVLMARSAVQAVMRDQKAKKGSLYHEINDLASRGIIPAIVKDLAHEVRELANPSAHPSEDDNPIDPKDAADIVEFLDFLLEYVYDLPRKINEYRKRTGKIPLED